MTNKVVGGFFLQCISWLCAQLEDEIAFYYLVQVHFVVGNICVKVKLESIFFSLLLDVILREKKEKKKLTCK